MRKWTDELLLAEAKKYKTKKDFSLKSASAYVTAKKRRILQDICAHMETSNVLWDMDKLRAEASKYTIRQDFRKKSPNAYAAANKRGLVSEICSHMPVVQRSKLSVADIEGIALRCSTRYEFKTSDNSAYNAALRMGILDRICSHMEYIYKYWTHKELEDEALKYKSKKDFEIGSPTAHGTSKSRGVLNEICLHMDTIYKYWTNEELAAEAQKYRSRSEFSRNSNAYSVCLTRGILDSVCTHMVSAGGPSYPERSILDTIKLIYPKAQTLRDRKVKVEGKPHIKGFDLDIYIPELRKGIEFDGKYWHSFAGLKRSRTNWPEEDLKNYHQIKDGYFKSKGISIYHVKETDWIKDQNSCVEHVIHFLNEVICP